ncbi:MAG: redox-regulated ATPase YchF [archaeon]
MLVGVVGKANCGKSTFFKAATLAEVEIANYPFTTVGKNEGVGFVKTDCAEKHFQTKCSPRQGYCLEGKRFVPIQMIDVAGLVPDAHLGKGRGNQFLDDLRQADALIHVIDISGSTNENGEPVERGSHDPVDDVRFLETEIDMWFYGILKKGWDRFSRQVQQEGRDLDKEIARQFSGLKVTEEDVVLVMHRLNLGKGLWTDEQLKEFSIELRKATKPIIIAANKIDVSGSEQNLERVRAEFPGYIVMPCSAESELALKEAHKHGLIRYVPGESFETGDSELSDKQRHALDFIKTHVIDAIGSTGVQEVLNAAVFKLLHLITAYPVATSKLADKDGNTLPDCILLRKGATALDFAFTIHTDIGNSFIRAVDMKTKQVVGKEHELKDGDVLEIVTDK